MASNVLNGFPIGYSPRPELMQQNIPVTEHKSEIIWVEGWAGAKNYMVAADTTVALWDSEEDVIYIKSADKKGKPTYQLARYTLEDIDLEPGPDSYITKEQFKIFTDSLNSIISDLKGALADAKSIKTENEPDAKSGSDSAKTTRDVR